MVESVILFWILGLGIGLRLMVVGPLYRFIERNF